MPQFSELKKINWFQMIALIGGGGVIYMIPYMKGFFYDTMISTLHLTNLQLGQLASLYGFVSMIGYFPGGWLADRLPARYLVSFSLILTGACGFYYATIPSFAMLMVIHAIMGAAATLIFWCAMIKAARLCGPEEVQGRIFSLLETGRMVLSGAIAAIAIWAFSFGTTDLFKFRNALYVFAFGCILFGVLSFICLDSGVSKDDKETGKEVKGAFKMAFTNPTVWYLSGIIFFSYTAFLLSDYLTPYTTSVYGMSASAAATLGLLRKYLFGPAGAMGAGAIADRTSVSGVMAIGFVLMAICFAIFALLPGSPALLVMMIILTACLIISVFSLRGIYFALFEEGAVPVVATGVAAGIASAIGYSSDAFIWTWAGNILDTYPGQKGYTIIFAACVACSVAGFLCVLLFRKTVLARKKIQQPAEMAA
ncbi:MAG: MFS transporter [Desulfobacterales bacterium]|nr:MFS transporter [Desulfobacterales bacterium]